MLWLTAKICFKIIWILDIELSNAIRWDFKNGYLFCFIRDKQQSKPTLRDLQNKSGSNVALNPIPAFPSEPFHNSQPAVGATLLDMSLTPAEAPPPPPTPEVTLTDVFVPLESIKPSK